MDRSEQLRHLIELLRRAVVDAREIALSNGNGLSREGALATQIEGIAMEFEIIARSEAANGD